MIDVGDRATRRKLLKTVFGGSEEALAVFADHYAGALRAGNRIPYEVAMILTRAEFDVSGADEVWVRKRRVGGRREESFPELYAGVRLFENPPSLGAEVLEIAEEGER